jgi:hypothetical protein
MPRKRTPKATTPLAEKLEYVMNEMDWKPADLTRAVGASEQSTIGNWLAGRNKTMEPRFAYRLQDDYSWNARWLLEDDHPPRLELVEPERKRIIKEVAELPLDRLRALAAALGL